MIGLVDYDSTSGSEDEGSKGDSKPKDKMDDSDSDESDNSGSDSDDQDDEKQGTSLPTPDDLFGSVKGPEFMNVPDPRSALPSANDIFSSVEQPSFMTGSAPPAQVLLTKRAAPSSDNCNKKMKKKDNTQKQTTGRGLLVPPQMQLKRPNHVTEATELWTKNKQGSKQQDKNKSFRHKEKLKRDRGQASRGKNYVEEEKRILRQMNM
mmetsp:Transcript_54854/g.80030  ORF Transcript_54854/g.80030 Transcript_54854/m.80030 type:complete len:207 (+) Transcript_54854:47-667(+)|eukprot:CAMPEP_0194562814 /NCGR_PEP_ID=MMETSP0292-20121207/3112_1 /TAXON_ID=39354 /ORGANISM="Heterosigma akashiwo, Strain CCMP2393" /LENGTH=206 /DNA_ID=CAMNT_0039411605 /DNA_START=149 /DNA_END=769 /DNA_ORIENTATION=+